MKVQYKLFLITLTASLILVSLMTGLAQWSLDRGLLAHVNNRAKAQYNTMVEPLTALYSLHGSWDILKQSPQIWRSLKSDKTQGSTDAQGPLSDRNHSMRLHRRPHENRRPGNRPHAPNTHKNKPKEKRSRQHEPMPPPHLSSPPLAIFDKNDQHIIGRIGKKSDIRRIPIIIDGITEGYLVYADRQDLIEDYDLDISSELSENLWWIAAIMILLSASLAVPFSRLLIRPIRPIVETLNQLAKGNLTSRVSTKGKDEIAQVGHDVNILAESLIESETSRKKWLANISHELRTPLAIMRGELEAMLDGIRDINQDNIQSAHQEALHLQRLVEDLYQLTSSDIGALSYHKQSIDFIELLEENIEHLKPSIDQAGLMLNMNNTISPKQDGAFIHADQQRISQVIINIIQNSIKYTYAPGTINITVSSSDKNVQLTIEDSAPSVEENELDKIFNHLYRSEASRNRKTGGSGLGLSISKKIIEGHNGKLKAELSTLGGICIVLKIPLCK